MSRRDGVDPKYLLTKDEERTRRDLVIRTHPITHTFWCGGCKCYHWIDAGWTVTREPNGPSVMPSVLTQAIDRCHLYVTNGVVRYLGDCTHELAGKTVPLEEFEEVKHG